MADTTQIGQEGFVQLPSDASNTGKQVRNLVAYVTQPDGTLIPVYMEATVQVDHSTGIAIENLDEQGWRDEVLRLLRAIARGLERIADEELLNEAGNEDSAIADDG